MWITIIMISIILLIIASLSGGSYWVIITLKNYAKKNVHFTTLGNEQGKLVMKEKNIVDVLSNMRGVYYNEKGKQIIGSNPRNYGSLFEEFGITYFGLTPIKEIYEFSVEWRELIEKEASEVKNGSSFEIVEKKEKLDYFKRFYPHAVQLKKVELSDGSSIDIVFVLTFEVLDIVQVIFKVKPDGIILAQAENAFTGALIDQMKNFSYEEFRDDVDKSDPNSPFVKAVLGNANAIIESHFFLRASLMEMRYFDLSKGEPGDEEFEKAQKALKIANLNGDAKIAEAIKQKAARKIQGEGNREYFEEMVKVIGANNIGEFANLEQVKDTQLLSYGQGAKSVTPVVNIPAKNKKP